MANISIIPEDYNDLKKEYVQLRKELDGVNQELYDCKRQLKIVEALQHEYESEIEILQIDQDNEKLKLEEKIVLLEETLGNTRLKNNEKVQALEVDLNKLEKEKEALQVEIDLLKKVEAAQNASVDTSSIFEELLTLRQEKDEHVANEEELRTSLEIVQKNYVVLEESFKEKLDELSNLRENISCKRDELYEANDLIQKLNDEVFCLKSELEGYKSKPLNLESKGNSLFAEVDDRRVYLQTTINKMKTDYICMKQERAKHLNTISHLRQENKTLCNRWKADMVEKQEDEDMILKSYKDRIQVCETLIDQYKKDLAVKPVVISQGTFTEIEFYQKMFNSKLKEIEELREQLSARSLTQIMLSTSLKEANKETRKWKLQATLSQYELDMKSGDQAERNKADKQLEELLERENPRPEPSKAIRGPRLACKREENAEVNLEKGKVAEECEEAEARDVILINDSLEACTINSTKNEEVQEVEVKEVSNIVVIEDTAEPNVELNDKENLPVNKSTTKTVTFSESTVSPKMTNRTAVKRNCRRLVLPKPVYIPSD